MSLLLAASLALLLGASAGLLVLAGNVLGVRLAKLAPWVVVAVLVVLAPWFLGARLLSPTNLLLGGMIPGVDEQVAAPHELLNDTFLQFLPWELEIRRQWQRGEAAFWSPSLEGGSSLWQNPQAGVVSPIAMMARVFPLRLHLLVALALKMVIGALGLAALALGTGAPRLPSLLAGLAFVLSGPVISWALFPHTATLVFVPWLCLASRTIARRPSPTRIHLTAIVLALMLASGHPEVAFVGGLLAAVFALSFRRRALGWPRMLGSCLLAVVLGLCLAAPALLPFAFQLPESQRMAEMRVAGFETATVLGFEETRVDLLKSFLSSYAYGRPYEDSFSGTSNWAEALSGSCGIVLLVAFGISWISSRRASVVLRRGGAMLVLFVAICWLAGSGWTPLLRGLRLLPLLDLIEYRRALLVAGVVVAVFGAHGFAAILRLKPGHAPKLLLMAGLLASASLAMGSFDGTVLAAVLMISACLPKLRWGVSRRSLLIVALVVAQVPWLWRMLPRSEPRSFFPASTLVEEMAAELAGGPWRGVGSGFEVYPSLLSVWGLEGVRTHNPMASLTYATFLSESFGYRPETSTGRYFSSFGELDHNMLDFLGVRAVVQPAQDDVPTGLQERSALGHRRLLINPAALPRWFSPTSWLRSNRAPRSGSASGARDVLIADCELGPATVNPSADPRVLSLNSNDVRLALGADRPELLATSVPWSPGWRALSDGRRLQMCRVNRAFLGVALPPEVKELRLVFVPPGLRTGVFLAGSAFGTMLLLQLGSHVRGRGRASPP